MPSLEAVAAGNCPPAWRRLNALRLCLGLGPVTPPESPPGEGGRAGQTPAAAAYARATAAPLLYARPDLKRVPSANGLRIGATSYARPASAAEPIQPDVPRQGPTAVPPAGGGSYAPAGRGFVHPSLAKPQLPESVQGGGGFKPDFDVGRVPRQQQQQQQQQAPAESQQHTYPLSAFASGGLHVAGLGELGALHEHFSGLGHSDFWGHAHGASRLAAAHPDAAHGEASRRVLHDVLRHREPAPEVPLSESNRRLARQVDLSRLAPELQGEARDLLRGLPRVSDTPDGYYLPAGLDVPSILGPEFAGARVLRLPDSEAGQGVLPFASLHPDTQEDIATHLHDNVFGSTDFSYEHTRDLLRAINPDLPVSDRSVRELVAANPGRPASERAVRKYRGAIARGESFPPILTAGDELKEGGHRLAAHHGEGRDVIRAVDIGALLGADWEGLAGEPIPGIARRQQSSQPEPGAGRDRILAALSANTGTIPGLKRLNDAAAAGDEQAGRLLSDVARDSLAHLLGGVGSAKVNFHATTGLYGGDLEASLGVEAEFHESDRPAALAALARFARNFNQEQVHVRAAPEPDTPPGHDYGDGSYNTVSYKIGLNNRPGRATLERVIRESGLYGLTAGEDFLEAYYAGDPADAAALAGFERGVGAAVDALGGDVASVGRATPRLWVYGHGPGAIPYGDIQGDVRAGEARDNPTARRVAHRLAGREVTGAEQAREMTAEQAGLHRQISAAYDQMRTNALSDPLVRRAYEELAGEVKEQYDALPVKVEILSGQGEPYKNSHEMRRDVLGNNHLYVFGTDPGTFGPPGVTYDNHPLLDDSGLKDVNGRPLLVNDLLRAVHDYYAHTLTPAQFGPLGEEAAWRNHMQMTRSPLARWALTSETRGQNSWVNFGPHGEQNRRDPKNTVFAEQKVDLLPVEFAMTGDAELDRELLEAARVGGRGAAQGYARHRSVLYEGEEGAASGSPSASEAPHSTLRRAAAAKAKPVAPHTPGVGPGRTQVPYPTPARVTQVKPAAPPEGRQGGTTQLKPPQSATQVAPAPAWEPTPGALAHSSSHGHTVRLGEPEDPSSGIFPTFHHATGEPLGTVDVSNLSEVPAGYGHKPTPSAPSEEAPAPAATPPSVPATTAHTAGSRASHPAFGAVRVGVTNPDGMVEVHDSRTDAFLDTVPASELTAAGGSAAPASPATAPVSEPAPAESSEKPEDKPDEKEKSSEWDPDEVSVTDRRHDWIADWNYSAGPGENYNNEVHLEHGEVQAPDGTWYDVFRWASRDADTRDVQDHGDWTEDRREAARDGERFAEEHHEEPVEEEEEEEEEAEDDGGEYHYPAAAERPLRLDPEGFPVYGRSLVPRVVNVERGADATLKRVFDTVPSHEELASWAGVLDGATAMEVTADGAAVTVHWAHPHIAGTAERTFRKDYHGRLECHNDYLVPSKSAPKGTGGRVLARQIEQLRAGGFDLIATFAAGNAADVRRSPGGTLTGFKEWPKYGYNQELPYSVKGRVQEEFGDDVETIMELYRTPGGREWWEENGVGLTNMEFDLSDDSDSMKFYQEYREERKRKGHPL